LPDQRIPRLCEPVRSGSDRPASLPAGHLGRGCRARQAAEVPETVSFTTKPAIAAELIAAALDAGAPCAFVLADALYGAD